jgi:hypothetical protein
LISAISSRKIQSLECSTAPDPFDDNLNFGKHSRATLEFFCADPRRCQPAQRFSA